MFERRFRAAQSWRGAVQSLAQNRKADCANLKRQKCKSLSTLRKEPCQHVGSTSESRSACLVRSLCRSMPVCDQIYGGDRTCVHPCRSETRCGACVRPAPPSVKSSSARFTAAARR
jgi:hypothetical protein